MKSLDIQSEDLALVTEILRTYVPEFEVRAFGSRARKTARKVSDLDLVIMTTKRLDIARLADLREAFNQSSLPFKVDIADWGGLSEKFRRLINKDFIILQSAVTFGR